MLTLYPDLTHYLFHQVLVGLERMVYSHPLVSIDVELPILYVFYLAIEFVTERGMSQTAHDVLKNIVPLCHECMQITPAMQLGKVIEAIDEL